MRLKPFLVGGGVVVVGFLLRGPVFPGKGTSEVEERPIRVEVLNGTTVNRAGQRLADRLRESGFDVVAVGNADSSDHAETLVLDRSGRPGCATAVADELGVLVPVSDLEQDALLEVTVILGADLAEEFAAP